MFIMVNVRFNVIIVDENAERNLKLGVEINETK